MHQRGLLCAPRLPPLRLPRPEPVQLGSRPEPALRSLHVRWFAPDELAHPQVQVQLPLLLLWQPSLLLFVLLFLPCCVVSPFGENAGLIGGKSPTFPPKGGE